MNIFYNRLLPRERITKYLLQAIETYPLTVLTAPMGYGKTTIAQEVASSINKRTFYINIPQKPQSRAYLWSIIFSQLDAQGLEIAHEMQQIGFPEEPILLHKMFDLCRNYAFPTLIIIDDYQYLDSSEQLQITEMLVRENIPDLRILLLSRTRPDFALEDLRVKNLATLITQDLLYFSEEEVREYFRLNGTTDTEIAKLAWKFSEGWAAALWLSLQSWRTHGNIAPIHDVEKLFQEVVFSAYSPEEQKLLAQLSILDQFTADQAAFITEDILAKRRLKNLHDKNAFLGYIPGSNTYQLHSIFKTFLNQHMEEVLLGSDGNKDQILLELATLYRRAGQWFSQTGDLVQAIYFYAKAGQQEDYLAILDIFSKPGDGLIVTLDSQNIPKILKSIPWEIRLKQPIGWLAFVYHYITLLVPPDAGMILEETIKTLSNLNTLSPKLQNIVRAEIELILGITAFNDLSKMFEHYHQAFILFDGNHSSISLPQHVWTLSSPHIAYMYLRTPGTYYGLVELAYKQFHEYQSITNGCGAGAQDLFMAEYFFETGAHKKVETHLMKSVYKANTYGQPATLIAAYFLLARIKLAEGKNKEAEHILNTLDTQISQIENPLLEKSLELSKGYISAIIGNKEKIRLWIEQGECAAKQTLYHGINFARIIYGKALIEKADWLRLAALAEDLSSQLSPLNNLFGQIHSRILLAIATLHIKGFDAAMIIFRQAISLSEPDNIIYTLAEYGQQIHPFLKKLRKQEKNNLYLKALHKANTIYCTPRKSILLTPREKNILEYVATGITNREIAQQAKLAITTVNNTLGRIYRKLEVENRQQAIRWWKKQKND